MSHEFYLNQWRSAMEDLLDVLQIECPNAPSIDISGKEGQMPHIISPSPVPSNPSPTPPVEKKAAPKAAPGKKGDKGAEKTNFIPYPTAFDHFASVYLRYLGIYKKLEDCYDQIVHPQKRRDIKIVLETVMGRMVQLRAELSKVTNDGLPSNFVNLEDMLLKMQLPASFASVSVPRYFVEPLTMESEAQEKKAKIQAILQENSAKAVLGDDKPSIELPRMTREVAIRIIQRHERGRQAAAKAQTLKEIQLDAARRTALHESKRGERKSAAVQYRDPLNQAAATIQRYYRGFHARQSYRMRNKDELTFIGMRASNKPKLEALDAIAGAEAIRQQRKLIQTDHEVKYVASLAGLEQDVILQDGPQIKESMWEARYNWWIEEREKTGKYPESFDGFYAKLNPAPPEEPKEEAKKGKEKPKKEEASKEKGKDDKKDDKKKKADEPPPVDPRPTAQSLLAPPEMVSHITEILQRYAGLWSGVNDSETNPNQIHDDQLAKSKLRPMVEEAIRLKVDADLLAYLENIRLQAVAAVEAANASKKKGKGKKKGTGEKKEKKKKSGSAKKDKKGEKKKKCCEGEKICAEAEMTPELMAKELVGMGVLQQVPAEWPSVGNFIGESNMMGSAYEAAGMALEPSMSQIRDCITQFAVLPLGSQYVKSVAPPTTSMLLFGPHATGKTTLARAIAKDSGAIWLDLSPRVVDSFTATKQDIAKLLHMTFTVAKEFAPAVISIDEVERIFAKKKKDSTDNAPKLKASLLSHRDQLQPTDRVLIVGDSRAPQTAELNDMLALFGEQAGGKILQTPCPDYDTRLTLWRHFIDSRLRGFCLAPAASDQVDPSNEDEANQSEPAPDGEVDARRKTLEQRLKELNLQEQHAETTEKLVINPDVVAGIGIEHSVYPPLDMPTSELLNCTTLSRNAGFNLSTLAFVSEGYTAGSIRQAVQDTLSNRRMARLQRSPKMEISEFLDQLCKTPFTFRDDIMQIREWAGVATGDAERRKTREAERAAAAEAAEAAKKKKKK